MFEFSEVERSTPARRASRFTSLRAAAIRTAETGKALSVSGVDAGGLRSSLYGHAKRCGLHAHINKHGDHYEVWCEEAVGKGVKVPKERETVEEVTGA